MSATREHAVQLHRSRAVRAALLVVGTLCLLLGLIGLFLPVLPTTPFVLLAAACYARASERFHGRLLANRIFGPIIREWEEHRSIPYRTKLMAIALMSVTLVASIVLFVEAVWMKTVLACIGVIVAIWLYRRPSRDRPAR